MDAFLFDLDGLLVDSEPLHYEAFCTTCAKFGFNVPWDFKTYCEKAHTQSMGLKTATLELFPEAEKVWQELYHTVKSKFSSLVEEKPLKLMPGVETFINHLKAHHKKMAVVTNSSCSMVLAICQKQPFLWNIPIWITREDYHNAKPSPDGYLKALNVLNIKPEKAAGFEDSPRGLTALKNAKVHPFFISSYNLDHKEQFTSFDQLMKHSVFNQLIK